MIFDDVEIFRNWWLNHRPINTPSDGVVFVADTHGIVLYRQPPYQVELFMMKPNTEIKPHIHPNVDSFEVYMGGDVDFLCDDKRHVTNVLGDSIRVHPQSWHGGKFGPRGGCFLSVQKWLNGVNPTFVGNDWHDADSHTSYGQT
jgi:quercetin dioxygenase-like cupin family protein